MRRMFPLAFVLLVSGCAHVSPSASACIWAPLAHPTMAPAEDMSTGEDAHVRAVSESSAAHMGDSS